LLLALVSVIALAGTKDMSYEITKQGDFNEVHVKTALSSYVFSEDGGTLKSAYLSFASYGSKVAELVPGTKTDAKTLERQYLSNVAFPFTTTVDGDSSLTYTLVGVDQPTPDKLIVEFQGRSADLTVDKKFIVHNDAYYTIDVQLSVENASQEAASIQMTVGDYTPVEKGPSLVYQFDDAPGGELLAQGSYTSFDGVGLMDKKTVFFLKVNNDAGVGPFMEREQSGNKRFGVDLAASPGTMSYSFSLYAGRRQYLLMEHSGLGTLDNPGTAARLITPVVQFLNIVE